jgi:catechol-2,3-dioxygenase
MTTLNHANLSSYDVPSLTQFFRIVFGLQVLQERGANFALLQDDNGFLLTLMRDKRMSPEEGYPDTFHVGFLLASQQEVQARYDALCTANYVAPRPAKLKRGGPPSYGFYCQAPGGVMVEVSTMAA